MEPFRIHTFICTQQKPEGAPSCPAAGSFAVLEALDHEIQSHQVDRDVQVTTCGCLGLCDEGPILVVYPAGVWYRRVQVSDVREIVRSHLRDGKPVERLMWNDPAAMRYMATEHRDKFRAAMAAREKAGMLPDRLEQMIRGYQPSRCLLTALELDLFTVIGNGASSTQIAKRIGVDARALGMLLNALVALNVLTRSGDRYENPPETTRFFVQGSKDNHRDGLLHTANIWQRWSTLTDAVRSGTRVPMQADENPEWTRNFIAGMQRNAKDRAPLLVKTLGTEGVRRILDLGGGSGAYSIAFAKSSRKIESVLLDLPEVIPLTSEYVEKAAVASQIQLRAGDMLRDDLGSGYDLVMLNAICHMFSEAENRELFRRTYQALSPNGRLAVQDFILNADKSGPAHAALFSLNMLVSTKEGASYSEPEYAEWMKSAGFSEVSRINLPGPSSVMVGKRNGG